MTRTRQEMGEAPTATSTGAPPLTRRRVDQPMDTPTQLIAGAAALGGVDRAGVPTDVRDLARAAAGYTRLVARHLDGPLDASVTDDLLHLGEIVCQHAARTDTAAGEERPVIRLVAAASRWLVFAAQLPLVGFPTGESTIATAVDQAIERAHLAGDVNMAGVL